MSPKRLSSVRLFASVSDISRYISSLYFAVQAGKLFFQEDGMCFGGRLGARVFVLVSDINFMKIVHSAIIYAWAIRKQKISGG